MNIRPIKKMPSAEEIMNEFPLSRELTKLKETKDQEIRDILTGVSKKFLLVIGPCSADNEDAVMDYVNRLAKIQEKVNEKILIIPRIYTNKPRTTGDGYKGMLHQPNPEEKPNLVEGLKAIRRMHIRSMSETGLTAADEMLYPENYVYFHDILSYVAVGARSVENQQHRLTVSGMDVAAGMKNPTSGDYGVMLNSVYAGQNGHIFIYGGWEVETKGNPYTHCVLRGAVNKHGNCVENYHYEDLIRLHDFYSERQLVNPAAIIDVNHSNSNKQYKEQIRISKEILHSMRSSSDIKNLVKGLMIESYIEEGCQKIGEGTYGKSITDPCLGWNDSEKLIYDIADVL